MVKSRRPPDDQYVDVGDVTTRYWALGEGGPPAILVHGLGGYLENWEDNIAALAQERRVYALDLVGCGRSDKPRVDYSIPYLTAFVHHFMTVQGIDKAALIGESMGGAIALLFALQYPAQVDKLVLADAGGLGEEVSLSLRLMSVPLLGELLSRPSRGGTARFLDELFYDQELVTDERIEEDYQMSAIPGARRCMLSMLRSMVNLWGARRDAYHLILDRLEEIEVPALVVWGAEDGILPVAHAHQAVERLPNARLHVFEACGHVPNIERAEAFNVLVKDFLSGAQLAGEAEG